MPLSDALQSHRIEHYKARALESAHPETGAGAPALAAGFFADAGPGAPVLAAGLAAGFLAGAGEAARRSRRLNHLQVTHSLGEATSPLIAARQPVRLIAHAHPVSLSTYTVVKLRFAKALKQEPR